MSTSILKIEDDEFQLVGDFTIEGITIETTLDTAFGVFCEIPLRKMQGFVLTEN